MGSDEFRHTAPVTFETKQDADQWLSARLTDITRGLAFPHAPLTPSKVTLADYASDWIEGRDLKPRTRSEYARLLDRQVLTDFGPRALAAITSDDIRKWYRVLGERTGPTERAHSYALLRTILGTAVTDGLIPANPCQIRAAGSVKRARTIRPATLDELKAITAAMPDRLRLLVLFAAWTALRFGEATELRRSDVDLDNGVLRVRRGVTRVAGEQIVGTPKSLAGMRDVAIPPHLLPLVAEHLERHTQPGRSGLLFPSVGGEHLAPSTLYGAYYPARHLAGRDDLRFHDLRHTGAVLAASTGATLAELMARLGHTTPAMAMRYQHVAAGRDQQIAAALSALALGG